MYTLIRSELSATCQRTELIEHKQYVNLIIWICDMTFILYNLENDIVLYNFKIILLQCLLHDFN